MNAIELLFSQIQWTIDGSVGADLNPRKEKLETSSLSVNPVSHLLILSIRHIIRHFQQSHGENVNVGQHP